MKQKIKFNTKELMPKLKKLQEKINILKQKEEILEKRIPKLTVIEESLSEIWDNEEDEIWNNY